MGDMEQYKSLISEIIAKQAVILGPDIAILKARNVKALELSADGKVTSISGDPEAAIQALIDEYVNLSGMIVKNALGSIFAKYPGLNKSE
ncbi:MAG: hypothetical protein A2493_01360 [Candidatus Magasanikbacteria bacterium RIFOXYC12_FULL_33_11]|uniref:Uncharacterized protein n=2 Tax=Candidatus Magasanikiibacteriota TaxID=1752731 RepID=A0A1F6NM12_9BACT|nr:MAG: hypothetical protein A2493_01360 [Candidatus Magasanikbacteria bacterium RIFOXYC12_FULL_33_11]PIZ96132.1 MAG: hypothetical protein COX80_02275 [Candidatus Magasanikbacteria bacterium CG_4_10_14_0_2_um_filter_33_14]